MQQFWQVIVYHFSKRKKNKKIDKGGEKLGEKQYDNRNVQKL